MKKYFILALFVLCLPLVLVGCGGPPPDSTDRFLAEERAMIIAEFRTQFSDNFGIELTDETMSVEESENGTLVITMDLSEDYDENRINDCVLLAMENLQIDYPNFTYTLDLDEPFAYVYIVKT